MFRRSMSGTKEPSSTSAICGAVTTAVKAVIKGEELSGYPGSIPEVLANLVGAAKKAIERQPNATLEEQVELVLQGMLRSEPEGGAPCLPYWFLPSDWSRLSETYQVDFVLHGLPGTEGRHCARCSCEGHVHTGPQDSGRDYCLHVGWSSRGSRAWTPAA